MYGTYESVAQVLFVVYWYLGYRTRTSTVFSVAAVPQTLNSNYP